MESVLVGVDHSESSRRALRFALERARVNHWRVKIVHVINWSRYGFPTPEDNEDRPVQRREEVERARANVIEPLLDWATEEELSEDLQIDTAITHGSPSEVLVDLAEEDDNGLIIVGRIGESNLKTAIFGSTASRLAQHASVPVVVVP